MQEAVRPFFVAFGFDYSNSRWQDLPHLREGLKRLIDALAPYLAQGLSSLEGDTTPTELMSALEDLFFEQLTAEDSVLVYLGGHGVRVGDDHFVAGPAARKGSLTTRTGLAASDVAQVVGQGRPRQVTLLLDACYSGAGAARLAAAVDALMSRERRSGISLFVMSSARALDVAADGVFADSLLDVLADPAPTLWSKHDRRIAPSQVARALRARIGDIVESHEHGYVEPLFPNLSHWQNVMIAADSHQRTRNHFLRAASGLEAGETGWCFVGRTEALSTVASWLRNETSGAFIVTGPPGSGKSAILGRVALLADPTAREEVARRDGAFDPEAPTTPALGSVSVAIHAREKSLDVVVDEIAEGLGFVPSPASPDEILAIASEQKEPTCVLIDALDEAVGSDAEPIADFLRELADLPGMKVLIGTRPDHARATTGSSRQRHGPILRALEPARVWDLQEDQAGGRSDIVAYVVARLSDPEGISPYVGQDEAILAIAEEVARRVDGVFLYARLIVQVLLQEPPIALEPGWETHLPGSGGDDLLADVVAEDLERIPPAIRDRVRHMLMALAWTEGEGLPRYRVWPAVATAIAGEPFTDGDASLALRHATWYLAESAESGQPVYRLHHEELVRFFRELTKHEL